MNLKAFLIGWLLLMSISPLYSAAEEDSQRTANLESRISRLEHRTSQHAGAGAAAFLFGAFCALWAQNTRRNAWLWFFLGLFFSVITVLVLLHKNSEDKRQQR